MYFQPTGPRKFVVAFDQPVVYFDVVETAQGDWDLGAGEEDFGRVFPKVFVLFCKFSFDALVLISPLLLRRVC